jgi:single-strand DNA-binding protein
MDINVVILTGNLTSDPELRNSDGGTAVAKLRIATGRPRGKEGEDRGADFVDVTVFGRDAENCKQYLVKGRKVAVKGRLHHSEWDGEDGRRQRLEVVADPLGIQFLNSRQSNEQPAPEAEPAIAAA